MLHIGNHGRNVQVILLYCEVRTKSKQRGCRSIVGNPAYILYSRNAFRSNMFCPDIPGPCFSVGVALAMIT